MLCRNPYTPHAGHAFGCGQCMPCRFNRRRLWTHRMMLEALVHPSASFATLTYSPENLPDGGTLVPRDLQLWLKRFRKQSGVPVRYFGVGEYGDFSWRPHYHLALFGVGREAEPLVRSTWGLGHVMLGDLTLASAGYIAGYVTKKMTQQKDDRLEGRFPEFARMSTRPGIGAPAIGDVAAALQNRHGWDEIGRTGDVPAALRVGPSKMPLGRYLRGRLRLAMNFVEKGEPDEVAYVRSAEMLSLYADAFYGPSRPLNFKEFVVSLGAQQALNMTTRARIHASRKGVGL